MRLAYDGIPLRIGVRDRLFAEMADVDFGRYATLDVHCQQSLDWHSTDFSTTGVSHETGGYTVIPAVAERTDELKRICLRYGVLRLDIFGSAAVGEYHPEESDLDFVVEFQPGAFGAYADTYFGLLENLERLFGRPVDLIVGSAIRNPYFLQSVEETRTPIYEA